MLFVPDLVYWMKYSFFASGDIASKLKYPFSVIGREMRMVRGFTTMNMLGDVCPADVSSRTSVLPSSERPSAPAGVYARPQLPTRLSWFSSVPSLVETASNCVSLAA